MATFTPATTATGFQLIEIEAGSQTGSLAGTTVYTVPSNKIAFVEYVEIRRQTDSQLLALTKTTSAVRSIPPYDIITSTFNIFTGDGAGPFYTTLTVESSGLFQPNSDIDSVNNYSFFDRRRILYSGDILKVVSAAIPIGWKIIILEFL